MTHFVCARDKHESCNIVPHVSLVLSASNTDLLFIHTWRIEHIISHHENI